MQLLVRHAHAGDKHYWTGPDAERPLSVRGWSQAEGLCDVLAGVRVGRLLTSPALRCRQTLLPLAATLGLEVELVDDLDVDGDVDHLADLLADTDGDGVVLCTHGEVLGGLLPRLRARGVIQAEGRLRYEKGSTWALDRRADGRYHTRYLPPRKPGPRRARPGASVRAELGRLAVEQQRLLATIVALTGTTERLAPRLGPRLAAPEAERAATRSQLDQVRQAARALASTQAPLVEAQRPLGQLLSEAGLPAPPARMVAGLTDAGAVLATTASNLEQRHPGRSWTVLAEQPLAVRAEPAQVERLMVALLDAAGAALPPAEPTWVIARATSAGAVVAIATDPASLPLNGRPSRPAIRRPPPPSPRRGSTPLGEAERLAAQLGGELTIATDRSAVATRLLLRFPIAVRPDEVWPDQPPFPATAGRPAAAERPATQRPCG